MASGRAARSNGVAESVPTKIPLSHVETLLDTTNAPDASASRRALGWGNSPRRAVGLAAFVLVLAHAGSAQADAAPQKRALPDYDVAPEPRTAEDYLWWVPRVALAPFHYAIELLIRRPLGAIITAIEENKLAQRALYYFTFGGRPDVGVAPTVLADFGVLPSVGLYFFWDDALAKYNHLRVHFGTWGPDWLSLAVVDRYDVGPRSTAALHASFTRRSDYPFYGLGPDSKEENGVRYAATTIDVGPEYKLRFGHGFAFSSAAGGRAVTFGEGTCCGAPTLQARIQNAELPSPPRFADGSYSLGYYSARAVYDSRDKRPMSQSGVRLEAYGSPATDVSRRPGNSWVSYGATAAGFVDLTGKSRVLSLSLATLFVDPISGAGSDIPFNELVSLGGTGLMRGYLQGRLVDRSAAVATLNYQWPIWAFLDGTVQASTGNVFGAGLERIAAEKLRLSTGIGLRTSNTPDNQIEFLVGFGTDTFENGARITSFRLGFGATRGF